MTVDEIKVWYICEDGKYNYNMYRAEYESDEYLSYKAMVEMLVYKYGKPYSHYEEKSSSMGSTFDVDWYVWSNNEESQKLRVEKNNNLLNWGAAIGHGLGTSSQQSVTITYYDVFVSNYVSYQARQYNDQQKEIEMQNKNYNGL